MGGWVAAFLLFFSPLNLKVPISRNTSSPHLFFLLLPKLIESSVAFLPACSRKLIECELDLKGAGLLCFEGGRKRNAAKKDREMVFCRYRLANKTEKRTLPREITINYNQ